MDVRHDDRGAAGGGGAADALAPPDADAGRLALKRTEDEFVLPREIEPGPVEVGEPVKEQRRHVGAVGDQIALALNERRELPPQLVIEAELVTRHYQSSFHAQQGKSLSRTAGEGARG